MILHVLRAYLSVTIHLSRPTPSGNLLRYRQPKLAAIEGHAHYVPIEVPRYLTRREGRGDIATAYPDYYT